MSVTDWQTWAPFVDALRRSAPPGTRVSEFVGTVGRGAGQGTYLDDGDAAARRDRDRKLALAAARTGEPGPRAELDAALRAVADHLPDTEQLVRVVAVHGGGGGARSDRDGRGAGGDAGARARGDGAAGDLRAAGGAAAAVDAAGLHAGDLVELIDLPPAVVSGPTTPVLEVVLEAGALPPSYRETLAPRPDAAPAPSADAAAVGRVVAERMPDAVGAAPDELDAAEAALPDGARLPDEVRALYAAAGSGALKLAPEEDRFGGFEIVPLRGSVLREAFLPAARFGTWTADSGRVAPEDPAGRVQAVIGTPLWFPVGTDGAGNVYAVDLAPGPRGHLGQVVLLDHEVRAGAAYRADSLAGLLVARVPAGAVPATGSGGAEPGEAPGSATGSGPAEPGGEPGSAGGPGAAEPVAASGAPGSAGGSGPAETLTGGPEFLALDPAGWAERLDAGTVPDTLKAAGLMPDGANPPPLAEAVAVASRLLELRGQAPVEVTRLTPPDEPAPSSGGVEPGRAKKRGGLLDRLFGR